MRMLMCSTQHTQQRSEELSKKWILNRCKTFCIKSVDNYYVEGTSNFTLKTSTHIG